MEASWNHHQAKLSVHFGHTVINSMREGHLCCKTASLEAVQFFSQMVINRGSFWTKLEGCQGKELAEKIYVLLSLFLVCKLEATSRQFRAGRSAVLTIGTDRHGTSPS